MFKDDLRTRISVIRDLQQEVLKQPNPLRKAKKLNELMDARENLKLQFYYADGMHDDTILELLDNEASNFVRFEELLLTRKQTSDSEFTTHLQNIMDTCEESKIFATNNVIAQAKISLVNIASTALCTNYLMKPFRINRVDKINNCINVLTQYADEKIENKPRSLDCCTELVDCEIEK